MHSARDHKSRMISSCIVPTFLTLCAIKYTNPYMGAGHHLLNFFGRNKLWESMASRNEHNVGCKIGLDISMTLGALLQYLCNEPSSIVNSRIYRSLL